MLNALKFEPHINHIIYTKYIFMYFILYYLQCTSNVIALRDHVLSNLHNFIRNVHSHNNAIHKCFWSIFFIFLHSFSGK